MADFRKIERWLIERFDALGVDHQHFSGDAVIIVASLPECGAAHGDCEAYADGRYAACKKCEVLSGRRVPVGFTIISLTDMARRLADDLGRT